LNDPQPAQVEQWMIESFWTLMSIELELSTLNICLCICLFALASGSRDVMN